MASREGSRLSRVRAYLELVKFQHTVFALPFALTAALVSAGGLPDTATLGWILLAMVSARTAAMGFNRIVDRHFDALNPRTAQRELPTGRVTVVQAALLVMITSALFVYAAHRLNQVAFRLSVPTLLVLFGYSFCKRFTSLSHFVLGFALGLAPIGAWVAVRGAVELTPVLLGASVLFWVAGFDVIYATLDAEFDAQAGLHSLVQRFGVERALAAARRCHMGFIVLLMAFGFQGELGTAFYLGVVVIALFLRFEHRLVSATDLRKVNTAFFTVNGAISLAVLVTVAFDLSLRRN